MKYGAKGKWSRRTKVNGTHCGNNVFGDPIFGTVKKCYYKLIHRRATYRRRRITYRRRRNLRVQHRLKKRPSTMKRRKAIPTGCNCSSKVMSMPQEVADSLIEGQEPVDYPMDDFLVQVPHSRKPKDLTCRQWKATSKDFRPGMEHDEPFAPTYMFHWCYVSNHCHAKNGWYGKVAVASTRVNGQLRKMKYCTQH